MSDNVQLGVGFGPGTLGFPPGEVLLRFGELAEEIGFAHYWVNDHLSFPHSLIDPLVLLSAVASRTKRIGLATGVYLLPLRAPAAVARAFASLDYISDGRVLLGVGVGGEFAEDFSAAGIASSRRGLRTDAAITILRKLWTGQPVSYSDEFFDLKDVVVLPVPVQQRMPIIVGGRSEAALRRVVAHGDGWLPYLMAPERIRQGVEQLRVLASTTRPRIIAHVFVSFADNVSVARQEAIDYLSFQYGTDMERTVDKSVPCGPPQVVAARLREYAKAGATDIVLRPLAAPDSILSVLENETASVFESWEASQNH